MILAVSNNRTILRKIRNVSSKELLSLCQLTLDRELSVHFEEDKTKSMLFPKANCLYKVKISYADYSIKQYDTVEYLVCHFHSKLSDSAMPSKVLRKINCTLKFLYWQCKYQFLAFRKICCATLNQSHFHDGFSSWYFVLNNKKKKLQKDQNKYISFYLNFVSRS